MPAIVVSNQEVNNDNEDDTEEDGNGNAMETPQLSDISSFNPDDPQVRQIDIDSSSLSSQHQSSNQVVEKGNKEVNAFPLAETDEEMSSEMSVADEVEDHQNE